MGKAKTQKKVIPREFSLINLRKELKKDGKQIGPDALKELQDVLLKKERSQTYGRLLSNRTRSEIRVTLVDHLTKSLALMTNKKRITKDNVENIDAIHFIIQGS